MSKIIISSEHSAAWITAAKTLKESGKILHRLTGEIAEANHIATGPVADCTEEDIAERQALRKALVNLTVKAGYAKASAGPIVARMMADHELRIRAERSDTHTIRPAKLDFAKLNKVARQFSFDHLLGNNGISAESMTADFWDSLSRIAQLGKAGKLPSNRKAWAL